MKSTTYYVGLFVALISINILSWNNIARAGENLALPHSPPYYCEIKHSTWCLLNSAADYADEPSIAEGYASTWIIRGQTWGNFPLVIKEPRGCRSGFSDAVKLIKEDSGVHVNEYILNRIIVRLKANGSCDLELMYPGKSIDPQLGAFFAAMSLVRPCRDELCEGEPISFEIRRFVKP